MRLNIRCFRWIAMSGLGLAAVPAMAQTPVGTAFSYQGRLTDSGSPANGTYDLRFTLMDADVGGSQVGPIVVRDDVAVTNGLFMVSLDFGAVFASGQRFLEIAVRPGASTGSYTVIGARQELTPAPYSLQAGSTTTVAGLTCTSGQVLKWAAGVWSCGADLVGSGTVTSVGSGAGLTGGPITGSGSLSIAKGGVTSSMVATGAIGLAQIDQAEVQARISGTCPIGEYFRGIAADGSVVCEPVPGVPAVATVHDPSDWVGRYPSIAIGVDGLPVISYSDQNIGTLMVAKCVNAACTGASTITTVDNPEMALVGTDTSIAIGTDGFPVISYYDSTADALKVAKCFNAACTVATKTTVDHPANRVGSYTSIATGNDGLPVISYFDETAGALKVAKCVNASCTGTSTITTVDNPANTVGSHTSIAIGTDGLPVISYCDETEGALKVAKCANAACNLAGIITTVDIPMPNWVGSYTSIAIGTDGRPVISYQDQTAGALKVAKCVNADCTGASLITTVDDPANRVGAFTSIAIGADGLPVISYYDETADALKVAKCVNAGCVGAGTITTVDDPPNEVGQFTSIAIGADGLPIISYYDATAHALKVAKCGTRSCQ